MKWSSDVVSVAICVAAIQLSVAPAGAASDRRLLQRGVDPATGAEIRLYQGERGGKDLSLEIEDASVLIRKQLTDGASVTTILSRGEQVTLALGRTGLVVTAGTRRVEANRTRPEQVEVARAMLTQSAAVSRATVLLGRLAAGPDSAFRHTARVTRAMLLSAAGNPAGAQELSKWARAAREKVQVARVSLSEEGPGECWFLYAREAIAAYIEYEDCMRNEQWWDIFGQMACAFIYDLRAIGAFSWWIGCVGLRG